MGTFEGTSESVLHYQPSRKTFLLMEVACFACCSSVRFEFRSTGAIANNNNNNNNNNIYLLKLGCYPVAVIILHVNKT